MRMPKGLHSRHTRLRLDVPPVSREFAGRQTRRPGRHRDLTTTIHGACGDLLGVILAADPELADCCDIELWNQVALLGICDLLISPTAASRSSPLASARHG